MRQTIVRSLTAIFLSLLAGEFAHGQNTSNWTGAVDGNWLTTTPTTNWGNGIPGSSVTNTNTDTAVFDVPAQPTVGLNLGGGNFSLGAIDYTDSTNRTLAISGTTGALTLNGATVNSEATTVIRNTGTGTLTISTTNAGGLKFGVSPKINVVSAGGTVQIDAPITQIGPSFTGLTKQGAGRLIIAGASTYTGDTNVSGGTLEVRGQIGKSISAGGGGQVFVTGESSILSGGTGSGTALGQVNSDLTSVTVGGTLRPDSVNGPTGGTNKLAIRNVALAGGTTLEVNIGVSGVNSGLDFNSVGSINFNSNGLASPSIVKLNGLTTTRPTDLARWTLGTGLGPTGIQVNTVTQTEGATFGTFTVGAAVPNSGPVNIDTTNIRFTLTAGDTFALRRIGGDLVVDFLPVPEPATVLAVGAAGLGAITWLRRKRKGRAEAAEPTAAA